MRIILKVFMKNLSRISYLERKIIQQMINTVIDFAHINTFGKTIFTKQTTIIIMHSNVITYTIDYRIIHELKINRCIMIIISIMKIREIDPFFV